MYVFLEKATFFFLKLSSFTVVKSLVTNGSRLVAKCFWIYLSFLAMMILRV